MNTATSKTSQNDTDETTELGAVGGEDQIDQTVDNDKERVSLVGRRLRRSNTLIDEESVQTEKVLALKHSRSGYLSRVTRLYGELNALMSNVDLEEVRERRKILDIAFDRFQQAYSIYVAQFNQSSAIENIQETYEVQVWGWIYGFKKFR